MFNVTRLAYKATNLSRNTVKAVKTKQINLANASEDFKEFYNHAKSRKCGYGGNIFSNIKNWIKSFINNYKHIKARIKNKIAKTQEEFGKKLSKRQKKAVTKRFLNTIRDGIYITKKEFEMLFTKKK